MPMITASFSTSVHGDVGGKGVPKGDLACSNAAESTLPFQKMTTSSSTIPKHPPRAAQKCCK